MYLGASWAHKRWRLVPADSLRLGVGHKAGVALMVGLHSDSDEHITWKWMAPLFLEVKKSSFRSPAIHVHVSESEDYVTSVFGCLMLFPIHGSLQYISDYSDYVRDFSDIPSPVDHWWRILTLKIK